MYSYFRDIELINIGTMYRDGIPENDQRVDRNIHKKVNYYGSKLPEFQQEQNAIS